MFEVWKKPVNPFQYFLMIPSIDDHPKIGMAINVRQSINQHVVQYSTLAVDNQAITDLPNLHVVDTPS